MRIHFILIALFLALSVDHIAAAEPKAVSTAPITSVSASGNSFAPLFSKDGHYLVFSSQAKNLTTNADLSLNLNLFRKDLISGSIDLISSGIDHTSGGNDDSAFYSISSNGQFVAFASRASNLVANDTNSATDIFIRDTTTGTAVLVSVNFLTQGNPSDPSPSARPLSSNPQISDDGRWVVFESSSKDLLPLSYDGPFPFVYNLFARDLFSNTTVLVSTTVAGAGTGYDSKLPRINGGGRFVTFVSMASNLVEDVTPTSEQLFMRDLQANTTTWITKNIATYLGSASNNYEIVEHTISEDGHVIAYKVNDKGNDSMSLAVRVFRYETATGSTLLLTTNSYPGTTPELSRDGRFLAYEDQTNVLVWDQVLQSNIVVSLDVTGSHPASGSSHSPAISGDGRFVAFLSDAGDLVTNASSDQSQVFWRDLDAGTTRLVSVSTNGTASNASHEKTIPVISSDGSRVAFESSASNLVPDDLNESSDVFTYDPTTSLVSLVSEADSTKRAVTRASSSGSNRNAANADASVIAYFGNANNRPPNELNSWSDIFVHNLISDTYQTISLGTNSLFNAEISADGRYVTYTRRISTEFANSYRDDVLRYDLVSGSNEFVNITSNGSASVHSMSSDGSRVAYQLADLTFAPGFVVDEVFVHDFGSSTNILISRLGGDGKAPLLSSDGDKVFFFSSTSSGTANPYQQLYVKLMSQQTTPRLVSRVPGTDNPAPLNNDTITVVVSGDSQTAVFGVAVTNSLYRYRINSDEVSFICAACPNGSLDYAGNLLAYEVSPRGTNRSVYLRDLETGQSNLLSGPTDLGLPPEAPVDAWAPVISSDARFILFLGRLATSVTNVTRLYVRDRALNQTLLLTPNTQGMGLLTADGAQLNISRDGRTAFFRSFAGDIVPGDYNDRRDVFVVRLGSGDSDGDGMDDDWELAYFNTLGRDGTGDFDGDGQTDLQEFRAGTDPTNKGSVLRALTVSRVGGGTTVFWNAVPGRSYRIEFKDNVDDASWTTVSGQVQTSGATGWIADPTASSADHRFYRVVAVR